jgi:hypothetical protein
MHKSRWFDACWLALCLAASSAWCLTAAKELSATFDEPLYVERGLECWRSGSHAGLMKLGTMPLPIDCATLPLYVYERWTGTEIDPTCDLDRVLPWARAAALVFWWLLLVYGWLAAKAIAGPWAGRLAAAWLACEPNLLAHASLATTDVAVSACLLALAYHFYAGRQATWWWRVALPGGWFGAAILAKASGLVFGPLCLLAVEAHRWWTLKRSVMNARTPFFNLQFSICNLQCEPALDELQIANCKLQTANCAVDNDLAAPAITWRSSLRDLIQIGLIGLAVTFIYCGCDWRVEPSFVAWSHSLPAGPAHDTMVWLAEHLAVFSNAGEGLVRQVKHNMRGHHGSYLLGRVYDRPLWYYFPVALAIKLALPLLIAGAFCIFRFAFCIFHWSLRKDESKNGKRKTQNVKWNAGHVVPQGWRISSATCLNWALAAALALFVFSMNCRVQIGIRLMLPLVVLLIVGVAAELVAVIRQSGKHLRLACITFAAAAVLWTGFAAWRVWPEGLCYANELWGGPADGYLCLSDSNYDWGQGLKELAEWRDRHDLKHLDVWYFGADPAVNAEPFRQLPLHMLPIGKPFPLPMWVHGRYLAVSTTLLFGTSTEMPTHRTAIDFLRSREPVARTSTFLIYDVGAALAQSPAPDQR